MMYNIQVLIVSTRTAALSQRKPPSAGTSRERIWRKKQNRETQSNCPCLPGSGVGDKNRSSSRTENWPHYFISLVSTSYTTNCVSVTLMQHMLIIPTYYENHTKHTLSCAGKKYTVFFSG